MEKQNYDYDHDIALGLKMFFADHGISYHTASATSGITKANLLKIITGESELSLPTLVRIAAAYKNEGIEEFLFDREIQKCLVQTVKDPDVFSATDLAYHLFPK